MYFKIDCEKVLDVGQFLNSKSNELDSLYRDVLEICNKIEENYVSEDSTVYLSKFRNYVKVFQLENNDLKTGAATLYKTACLYSGQEDNWVNTIVKSDLNQGGRE